MSDEKESNTTNDYQDIDYSIQTLGPHYVDQKYFKPGYVYKLVGNLPGQIEKYEKLGHQIVKDEVRVGSEKPNQPHSHSSAVTVQSRCGQTMYLMSIPVELQAKLDKFVEGVRDKNSLSVGDLGSPTQYGTVIFK